MLKTPESSRREFLSNTGKLVAGEALPGLVAIPHPAGSAETAPPTPSLPKSSCKVEQFYFGASVYPELQTRDEWSRMLDHLQRAQINLVRVSESSWGNLETAAGQYNFEWLQQFLDDLSRRKMKAILGTGSDIPPQWFGAGMTGTLPVGLESYC